MYLFPGGVGDVDTETVQHDGDEMVAKSNETNDNENDDGTDLAQRKEVAMDAESNATNEEMMDEEKKDKELQLLGPMIKEKKSRNKLPMKQRKTKWTKKMMIG